MDSRVVTGRGASVGAPLPVSLPGAGDGAKACGGGLRVVSAVIDRSKPRKVRLVVVGLGGLGGGHASRQALHLAGGATASLTRGATPAVRGC